MSAVARVSIHHSQFPAQVRADLLTSLRTRQVNHKFLYDSIKQTQQWLALHAAYSPSRTDDDCAAIYDRGFDAAAECVRARQVHVVGLGCGGGQKDTRLLRSLRDQGCSATYTPCDVSVAMVLVARQTALEVVDERQCHPLVADLLGADDLAMAFTANEVPGSTRLVTFFGMIPNFEPDQILPKLAGWLRRGDWLLFSANLAPGRDYAAGIRKILPLYDNELTRAWLLTFLLDLGAERGDGELAFSVENDLHPHTLKRITAHFRFTSSRALAVGNERFRFQPGDRLRLFFSYRHTPERVRRLLARHALEVTERWVAKSGEEGVFLCRRR